MSLWRYAEWIDAVPEAARVTLGEGGTPLVRSRRIGPRAGLDRLYFKLDFANPSGSYKDRFAFTAVSHMVAAGQTRCVATSSGNTGAALAAYCAAAGIECVIAIVEGAPLGKLQQMLAYGAQLVRIRGFGLDPQVTTDAFEVIKQAGAQPGSCVQISSYLFSPRGMSGVKTLAYELSEEAPGAWDHVFCPSGGGGLCLAMARGFADLVRVGRLPRSPRVEVVQPEGNDTIATPLRSGAAQARLVTATTKVSGLQVPNVNDGHMVVTECRATGGTGHTVADDEVWELQGRLAREEGVFCEPAGAVALAGALKARREGLLAPDAAVVCVVSGFGFKDPASVEKLVANAPCPLIDLAEFRKRML